MSERSLSTRGRWWSAAAVGLVLSVASAMVAPGVASAEAPAVAVTGLARGARGDAVRTVQQALVDRGLTVAGGVDGVFGSGTEAAVKEFQRAQGLAGSGVVDEATALALGLASSPMQGLAPGMHGDAVRELQQRLIAAGFRPAGGADGVFGPSTKGALERFQRDRGLSASGTVDAATAVALAAVGGSSGPQPAKAPAAAKPAASAAPSADSGRGPTSLVGLRIGSRGEAVKQLQRQIMASGFPVVGGADGIFGVLTASALRSFQNANGLDVTGVVDEATAALLASVAAAGGGEDPPEHDPTVSSPLLGLQYGAIGSDVKALQQALIDAGFRPRGGADGVFGTATLAALKQYQSSRGLGVTGKVDEATANALSAGARAIGGGASPMIGLKAGALGNTVKQLQQALIDAGVRVRGGADGIFGPATADALKRFQESQGLPPTGVVDDATVAALAAPKAVGGAGDGGSADGTGGYPVYGEKGQRVIDLQAALVRAGITVRGGVDGVFGGGTSAAVMDFQRREGLAVSGRVDEATAAKLGLAAKPAPARVDPTTVKIDVFPVQGTCYFGDSWGYARGGGRVHLGVDIIGPRGRLVYAVADGRITKVYKEYPGSLAGNGVRLTTADGTYFFYAHMDERAPGIEVGTRVVAGQILGTLGSTGSSGTPHLHFEIHPRGGSAINPYPVVKAIDGCGNTAPLPQP